MRFYDAWNKKLRCLYIDRFSLGAKNLWIMCTIGGLYRPTDVYRSSIALTGPQRYIPCTKLPILTVQFMSVMRST